MNPSFLSWEKGLYTTCHSIMGFLEDELLHVHNTNHQVMRPPFPGTDYESQERESLFTKSEVASMTEDDIVKVLTSTPFEEMRSDHLVTETSATLQDSHAHLGMVDEYPSQSPSSGPSETPSGSSSGRPSESPSGKHRDLYQGFCQSRQRVSPCCCQCFSEWCAQCFSHRFFQCFLKCCS
jgi:hypothetical protein